MHRLGLLHFDARTLGGKIGLLALLAFLVYLFNDDCILLRLRFRIESLAPIQSKISHPFSPVATFDEDESGHWEKLSFRFVPYLLAHVLQLDYQGLILLQRFLGLAFPLVVWNVFFEATGSVRLSTGGTILINGLYTGFSFFVDLSYFDSFAYLFLSCAMLRQPRFLRLFLLMCACFTDERAILSTCLVAIWRLYLIPNVTFREVWRESYWQVGFLASYAILRLVISEITGLSMGWRGVGIKVLEHNIPILTLLTWYVFEGGWVLVAMAGYWLLDHGNPAERFLGVLAGSCLLCILLVGLLVSDSIRSQQYAFPLLMISILLAGREHSNFSARNWNLALVLTLFTPIIMCFGMRQISDGMVYSLYPIRPGYLNFLLLGFL